jgi:hypothetical protein
VVRGSGVEIICHALNLNQESVHLLSQVRELARLIASAR